MKSRFIFLKTLAGAVWLAASTAHAQSISVEMLDHFSQTSASAPAQQAGAPYSFEVHLNSGGSPNMAAWGPAFYRPGTGGVPDSGSAGSYSTNTGTLNFPASPNDGANYFFQANFSSAGAMAGVYPTSGSYGINFTGTTPPSPNTFSSGTTFSGGGFAASAPQVTGFNNGAGWSAGSLKLSTAGTTTLTINSGGFTEYGAGATYGTLIQAALKDQSGTTIAFSQTIYASALGFTDSPMTQFAINGALLTPGQTYELSFQYGILASTPVLTTTLNGTAFSGSAVYYNNTSINVTAIPEPATFAALTGAIVLAGAVVYRRGKRRHAQES